MELAATQEERRAELLASYHFDINAGLVLATPYNHPQGSCAIHVCWHNINVQCWCRQRLSRLLLPQPPGLMEA